MIPDGVTLYTWVDVEEVLLRSQDAGAWPTELVEANAYWDELLLRIKPGGEAIVRVWLSEQYAPRFVSSESSIQLEAVTSAASRALPCRIEIADSEERPLRNRPSFARPRRLRGKGVPLEPLTALPDETPPIVAFHSFKGGVGRTTHAIGFALHAAGRNGKPVLLIDGDFEAPGITWHVRDDARISIAYADFLALVHSDTSPNADGALSLTANRLARQKFGNLIVMPAFRAAGQWSSLEVPPSLLQERLPSDPYQLTSLLARLGKMLGASAVVVDLRAGISELSAGLLLDPRVSRVLVTTLSAQSLEGTKELLSRLGRARPSDMGTAMPSSAIIINSVPRVLLDTPIVEDAAEALVEAGQAYFGISGDKSDDDSAVVPLIGTFHFSSELLMLPAPWEECVERLEKENVPQVTGKLLNDFLPSKCSEFAVDDATPLSARRASLAAFAKRVEYAEGGGVDDFLRIRALSNLARDFRTSLPLTVVAGAKGSGKTYAFLQMLRIGVWGKFVFEAGGSDAGVSGQMVLGSQQLDFNATRILPVILPVNLQETADEWAKQAETNCAQDLGFGEPVPSTQLREVIALRLRQPSSASRSWVHTWLDVIAWRCGFRPSVEGVGEEFLRVISTRMSSVVAVVDGLEDLFQDIHSSTVQQEALRSLLQEVPQWLRQAAGGRVGLLVFLRIDLVRAAIPQNTGQFLAKHEPYQLRWDTEEALRLAAWTCERSGTVETPERAIQDLREEELDEYLQRLWGAKMGSKSGGTWSHRWVLAALSDFNGQLQARDMIRLIARAASRSAARQDDRHADRLLVAGDIREAMKECGEEKIKELEQETPPLKSIFQKIRETGAGARVSPFVDGAYPFTGTDIDLLIAQGLIARDKGEYYMPELVRVGLGVEYARRGRPRMLAFKSRGAVRRGP